MKCVAFLFSVFFIAFSATAAQAAKIKKVNFNQDSDGIWAELVFDKPVSARSLKWEAERNFGQVVLKNVVMDNSKIFRASASSIEKVMVYPYSNDTVRVRFISTQKTVQKAQIRNQSANVVRIYVGEVHSAGVAKKEAAKKDSKEEDELIKEVVANTREIDISNPDSLKAAIIQKTDRKSEQKSDEDQAIQEKEAGEVGTKNEPTRPFLRMIGGLIVVLAVMGGLVLGLKKYGTHKLPFGKKERIIQVVATHYLGSKKSISLVKVAGEYMVVGASNDNISLISKLGAEVSVDKYLEDRFWGGTFEKHLGSYTKDIAVTKDVSLDAYDGAKDLALENKATKTELTIEAKKMIADQTRSPVSNVRSSIRDRLSQLKPLS